MKTYRVTASSYNWCHWDQARAVYVKGSSIGVALRRAFLGINRLTQPKQGFLRLDISEYVPEDRA